jgi:hypothetical protein
MTVGEQITHQKYGEGSILAFMSQGIVNLDVVRSEVWTASADRVDVFVIDDAETEVASYALNSGVWTYRFDNLVAPMKEALKTKKSHSNELEHLANGPA